VASRHSRTSQAGITDGFMPAARVVATLSRYICRPDPGGDPEEFKRLTPFETEVIPLHPIDL
jgi:hypothetical protein